MNTIESVAYHRNGVSGEGFYVVTFQKDEDGVSTPMVGIVFDYDDWLTKPGQFRNCEVAVLNRELVGEGDIRFGYNSFRGDHFASDLYEAIKRYSDSWVPGIGHEWPPTEAGL